MTYVQKNLYPEFDIRNNIVIYNKKFKRNISDLYSRKISFEI